MSLIATLTSIFADAFESQGLDRSFGQVVVSARPDLAQFQCNGAMAAAKQAKKNPREVAQAVLDSIAEKAPFSELDLAGPGFINISLTDEYLAHYIDGLDTRFGCVASSAKRIVVDYGGPNVAKELHVGHLRPAIIGESMKRVLRFLGNDVVGDVHLGDWGMPYGQLITELSERYPDLPYFDESQTDGYPDTSPV
ncbi:MAG: arginine--tRNA ligase, partial [bacterium]|nr:arginine--tRNA ligase [bacterium]